MCSKEEILADPRFPNSRYDLYFDYKTVLEAKIPSHKKLDDEAARDVYNNWKMCGKLQEDYEFSKFW